MGGLAFSALTILCFLIPGFIFHSRYYGSAAENFEISDTIDTSAIRALVMAVLFALPLHAVWGYLISQISACCWPIGEVNYREIVPLLVGEGLPNDSRTYTELNDSLIFKASLYVWSQSLFAFFAGNLLARTMKELKWDERIALRSKGAFWHASLHRPENDPDGIIVSISVELGDAAYVYYGLLDEYHLTADGDLERVVLAGALRRPLEDDNEEQAYEIPGELLIVDCTMAKTVDIDYFWIKEKSGAASS